MKMSLLGMGLSTQLGGIAELRAVINDQLPRSSEARPANTEDLINYLPPRKLRRIDHFTRMGLLAAHRTLEDANQLAPLPDDMGIIISSGYGPSETTFDFLDSIIDDGAHLASPLSFSHSVHNIPAGVLSMMLGRPCPQTTICQLNEPVIAGLRTAALWLMEQRVTTVLFGAMDESTQLLIENGERLAQERGHPARQVGEGCAFFLLTKAAPSTIQVELNTAEPMAQDAFSMAPLWGDIPVVAAFDMVAATLLVRNGAPATLCRDGSATIRVSKA
ncbi:beta-ketoacyl synthase chain length factor [Pseudodesulfovibrio sediminis]|uniref:Beta-ketoacyl synthase-like N-terminal domain-containing protein n=1 Tax=Pseudodesulfovibrio sediminis TaxID=2810563 RepID=A0ABM7P6A2_9BACT|nr:beta-ketoacyl synthase chain length factor [Pseudodesulfovibrio sediminis]BCS88452.1 hypothetical protein PSDVSF_16940 [Pseudodesulfovibrio sediminis]